MSQDEAIMQMELWTPSTFSEYGDLRSMSSIKKGRNYGLLEPNY